MFIVSTLEDSVQIEPRDFTKRSRDAIEDNINATYANKIIHGVGLCICFFDLLSASDGIISNNSSGIVNVKVTFRIIVFRPFRGEIIEAKISSSSDRGINLHTEFFTDIFIPGPNLFPNSKYDAHEQVWIWHPDAAATTPFYFDRHERVRFRVEEELWTDLAPGDEEDIAAAAGRAAAASAWRGGGGEAPGSGGGGGPAAGGVRLTALRDDMGEVAGAVPVDEGAVGDAARGAQRAWRLVGSMQQAGLGVCSWWEDAEEDMEMAEEAA